MKKIYFFTILVCFSVFLNAQTNVFNQTLKNNENSKDGQFMHSLQELSEHNLFSEGDSQELQGSSNLKSVAATPVAANKSDSLALVALYNATNGPGWRHNAGWLVDSVYKWSGIRLNDEGRVIRISFWNNQLKGNIPAEIGNLSELEYLYLASNQLTGNIPSEIGKLTKLTRLYLHRNQLSGSIPSEIGKLSSLQSLNLNDNQLSGNIPSEIGNLSNLKYLYLRDNRLSGKIPSEIGNLTNLNYLYLKSNQLSDTIPSEFKNLLSLRSFDVSENLLTQDYPICQV